MLLKSPCWGSVIFFIITKFILTFFQRWPMPSRHAPAFLDFAFMFCIPSYIFFAFQSSRSDTTTFQIVQPYQTIVFLFCKDTVSFANKINIFNRKFFLKIHQLTRCQIW